MNEHITQWLEAYHDGELHGKQLGRVEAHLKRCTACRADLARLESLTSLLAESPAPAGLKSADQFEAEIRLRIPARPEPTRWGKALRTSWRLAPAALIGVLVFLQTTNLVGLLVTAVLRLAPDSMLTNLFAWQARIVPENPLALEVEVVGRALVCGLTGICPLGLGGIGGMLIMLAVGTLYLSWLATWLARQRHHQKLETITARSRGWMQKE